MEGYIEVSYICAAFACSVYITCVCAFAYNPTLQYEVCATHFGLDFVGCMDELVSDDAGQDLVMRILIFETSIFNVSRVFCYNCVAEKGRQQPKN